MKSLTMQIILLFASTLIFVSCCNVSDYSGNGEPKCQIEKHMTARYDIPRGIYVDAQNYMTVAGGNCPQIIILNPANPKIIAQLIGKSNSADFLDGPRKLAKFNQPLDVVEDKAGNIFVTDSKNHVIRKIDSINVSTVAGDPNMIMPTSEVRIPVRTDLPDAMLIKPTGITIDRAGILYVTDYLSCSVRRIDIKNGYVETIGKDKNGNKFISTAGANAKCSGPYSHPTGIDLDAEGNIFIAEHGGDHRIIRIDAKTEDTTVWAGSTPGYKYNTDGLNARFGNLQHLSIDKSTGDIYVVDQSNHCIFKIKNNAQRYVTKIAGLEDSAGQPIFGSKNGGCLESSFKEPCGIHFLKSGKIFVSDAGNHKIRLINK